MENKNVVVRINSHIRAATTVPLVFCLSTLRTILRSAKGDYLGWRRGRGNYSCGAFPRCASTWLTVIPSSYGSDAKAIIRIASYVGSGEGAGAVPRLRIMRSIVSRLSMRCLGWW